MGIGLRRKATEAEREGVVRREWERVGGEVGFRRQKSVSAKKKEVIKQG